MNFLAYLIFLSEKIGVRDEIAMLCVPSLVVEPVDQF
jgi:hypothetical protein